MTPYVPPSPSLPSAFGCQSCVRSAREAAQARRMTARLLRLLTVREADLDAARRVIEEYEDRWRQGGRALWEAEAAALGAVVEHGPDAA